MDFLKAEIARKKKQMEESKVVDPEKKYFKRKDLAEKQEEEYWKKHKRMKSEDGEETLEGAEAAGTSDTAVKRQDKQLSRKEVIRQLRERDEPIRLFGESDYDAYERLKKLMMSMPEVNKGLQNDFKMSMDAIDQDYLNEMLEGKKEAGEDKMEVAVKHDDMTKDKLMEMSQTFGTGDDNFDQDFILKYFKLVLKLWGQEMNGYTTEQKLSFHGKMMRATHHQTVEYIKPLFKKLKKKALDKIILECLVDIVKMLLNRQYIKANDAYVEMAIGNAPWPIGVTMVGIHARTGREKISARNVAHVLNDETQRKYIQAVKRLMTQAQKHFPTDPSYMPGYEKQEMDAAGS